MTDKLECIGTSSKSVFALSCSTGARKLSELDHRNVAASIDDDLVILVGTALHDGRPADLEVVDLDRRAHLRHRPAAVRPPVQLPPIHAAQNAKAGPAVVANVGDHGPVRT
jgi:hypothetical protein